MKSTITEIRKQSRLNRPEFSKKYDIPIRTLEGWESCEADMLSNNPEKKTNSRAPKKYIVSMLARLVDIDFPEDLK